MQCYLVALASIARHHTKASLETARQGYRVMRGELNADLQASGIDEVLALYRVEGCRPGGAVARAGIAG